MSGALTTIYDYDANNNLIHETDPKGNITISDYTPFGEVGFITDPMGNKKEFTYDANGNITLEKTLPSTGTGITTITRTYDRENRLLSATPINTGSINQNTESYVYDKTGNRRTNTNTSTYTTNTLNQYTIRIIPITLMVKLVS